MDTSNATSVVNVSASSSTSTIYDLGNMSKDEVVKPFEELGVFRLRFSCFLICIRHKVICRLQSLLI